jgi:ribonuclease Z
MRLIILGSGTAAPHAERVASGFYLEIGRLMMLLDCGPGVVHHMARFGVDWEHLTHLLITHFHNDHIGDVPALFFGWRYGMLPARREPLQLVGPKGMKKKLKHMARAMGDHVTDPGFVVNVDEIGANGERLLNDVVHLKTLRTPHTSESIAFRLDAPDGSFGYTGDTGYSDEVSAFMARVDVLIMECSLPNYAAMDSHLTPTRVARMAQQANPGVLVLTHVYPQIDRTTLAEQVRDAGWTGDTVIATDGMIIEGD